MQRIQSVYLFLSSLAGILFLFLPLGKINESEVFTDVKGIDDVIFIILSCVISIIALGSIFLFRNRKLQMKVILFNILCSLALVGYTVYVFLGFQESEFKFGPALILPVFILIFNVLAYIGVKSDEQLIESMNRLR
ncbi:MAG: DUF4293 domain-containing protein [Chitinophagales bacterium]|nr:DUF4293 domain-containing protein [Chitinophagales bacterium]